MKGCSCDRKKIRSLYGDISVNIEDVEKTRLEPYHHSASFIQMIEKFAGIPLADFKDKKVSISDWSKVELSIQQILYSAFDVVGLYKSYPNFPPEIKKQYRKPTTN